MTRGPGYLARVPRTSSAPLCSIKGTERPSRRAPARYRKIRIDENRNKLILCGRVKFSNWLLALLATNAVFVNGKSAIRFLILIPDLRVFGSRQT